MLKPYVCVVCEKVILAKDNIASLIGLFSKLILTVPVGSEIPKNAVSPKEWAVFSIWDIDPGDEKKQYEICVQILYPDGTQFAETVRQNVVVELGKRSQMVVQVNGFPIGQIGDYTVRTWIEESQQRVVGPIEIKLGVEVVEQQASPVKTAV